MKVQDSGCRAPVRASAIHAVCCRASMLIWRNSTCAPALVHRLLLFITLMPRIEWYKVYEHYVRALLRTAAHFCKVIVLEHWCHPPPLSCKYAHMRQSGSDSGLALQVEII